MSIQAVAWAISQRVGSPTGKVLLMCLANYANDCGECWPSQKTISREAELSERSTRDWLQKLEVLGFITRSRRHRSDGSRTSDFVILNLNRPQNSSEKSLAAESAVRPSQAVNGSKPSGSSRRTYRQELPPIEPSSKPSIEPSTGAHEREADGFRKLWDDWPSKDRPDKRAAAKWAYDRLSVEEQSKAVAHAKPFHRLAKAKKRMALMIPYLKQRQFVDIEHGPTVNQDGQFVFTPERPEWDEWIAYLTDRYSPTIVAKTVKRGTFMDVRRWPPKVEPQMANYSA